MTAAAPTHLVFLLVSLVAILWGLRLLRRSRGRVGETPHCGGCDYDLTANASAVCPECGLGLDAPGRVVLGDAVWRRRTWARGFLMFLLGSVLGGTTGVHFVRTYDWYRVRPAGWLIDDVTTGYAPAARRAWRELDRRIAAGGLSDAAQDRLTAEALAKFERVAQSVPATVNGPLQVLSDYLGDRALAGKLTPAQRDEFFAATLLPQLRFRRLIRAGDPIPVELTSHWVGPSAPGWWVNAAETSVTVGGATELKGTGRSAFSGFGSGGNATHFLKPRPAGDVPVTVAQTFRAYRGSMGDTANSQLIHQWTVRLTGQLHVVADEPPGTFTLIDRPELLPAMRAAVTIQRFALEHTGAGGRPLLQVRIGIRNPPENIAFDVTARAAGREFPIGSVRLADGQGTTWHFTVDAPRGLEFDKADFHFRPNEKAARSTVNLYQIWNGELLVKDVPLTRAAPATRPSP
jgi:hypothetical protein